VYGRSLDCNHTYQAVVVVNSS